MAQTISEFVTSGFHRFGGAEQAAALSDKFDTGDCESKVYGPGFPDVPTSGSNGLQTDSGAQWCKMGTLVVDKMDDPRATDEATADSRYAMPSPVCNPHSAIRGKLNTTHASCG
jgi:hypothetical protein